MMFLRCVMFESSVVSCRPVIVLKPAVVSHILRHPVIEEPLLWNLALHSMLPLIHINAVVRGVRF